MKTKEINLTLEKGSNELLTINFKDEIESRLISRYLLTRDRWIKIKPQNIRGTTSSAQLKIVSRGLFGGYHRGIINVSTASEQVEYIIHLFVVPKKRQPAIAFAGASV